MMGAEQKAIVDQLARRFNDESVRPFRDGRPRGGSAPALRQMELNREQGNDVALQHELATGASLRMTKSSRATKRAWIFSG